MSKRAKSESSKAEQENNAATTVFNSPYLVREIVRWNGAKDFKSARLVVKGGINWMWNAEDLDYRKKFRKETMALLTEDLEYRVGEEYESIEFLDANGNVIRIEYAVDEDPTNLRVTEYKLSVDNDLDATYVHTWSDTTLETRDGRWQRLSRRPDGRTDFKERKEVKSYISFIPNTIKHDTDIFDTPFEPENRTIRPDLWAKYPFNSQNVDNDTLKFKQ